jgi:hypothetical protein
MKFQMLLPRASFVLMRTIPTLLSLATSSSSVTPPPLSRSLSLSRRVARQDNRHRDVVVDQPSLRTTFH